ncbi:hypothetical protein BH18CHL2_BH18CHL2_06590 [soil metagenome]
MADGGEHSRCALVHRWCVAGARAPEALERILSKGAAKADIAWSTAFELAELTGAPAVAAALILLIAFGLAAVTVRAAPRERREITLVAASAALLLSVTPYAQPYDFLLVVPALALAVSLAVAVAAPARAPLLVLVVLGGVIGPWVVTLLGQLELALAPAYAVTPVVALGLTALASVIVPTGAPALRTADRAPIVAARR